MRIKTDVVIVGTGVAGMFSALKLPRDKKIVIITKEDMRSSDSFLAQGGICVLRDENDYDSYFEDTMKAGHYENRKESVDIMIRGSRDIINDLVGYGVDFKMDGDDFAYTREGAHSRPRILYHEDITGKEISEKLLQQVLKLENVTILEYTTMQDILVENGKCTGLKAVSAEANRARLEAMETEEAVKTQEEIQSGGEIPVEIYAQDTILASGGIGGRYVHSTNYPHLTGDALDIAKYQLKRNSAIKKVSVDITYPVKNEWTSGNYILVTVKAKIKTIAPIKTKIHKKQILVTIEGISGQSIVIPSNVAQTGILGGSDATNYTSWAPRLGFDCRPVAQLWLRNPTYMDNIATIGGLYCVAVKPTFGKTGDRIRVCLEDGQYFDCIMADVKGADATNPYGHVKEGKVSVVEFYAKGDPSNSASLASPIGKSSWLGKKVKKIINMGRYPGL